MLITICSSVDFTPEIIKVKRELEARGHRVNIPYFTQKIIDGEVSYEEYMITKNEGGDNFMRKARSTDMIRRYWKFIKDSDAILVLNLRKKGIEGYVGGSTLMEMGFAYGMAKKIFLYNSVPERSERIHYVDEILDMKPIVINRNLEDIK